MMTMHQIKRQWRFLQSLRAVHQLVERRQTSVSSSLLSTIRLASQSSKAAPLSTLASSSSSMNNDNPQSYWNTMVAAAAATALASAAAVAQLESVDDDSTVLLNWSGTHSVRVPNECYFEPETVEEVEAIVQECHKKGQPLRPIGAALSPNAVGFSPSGMIGLAGLDKILQVDTHNQTVTVQAGARVSQVVEALEPHGLTLPNLASIAEQQMGGFVQIGAHGTGRCIAPVDHYVTKLKIVTPGRGTVVLTPEDGEMFELAKVGLGCLGVVVEVTMKCIPAHRLVEHTFVLSYEQAKEQVDTLLKNHKHMRYMWIPYADTVVVVTNDPEDTFGGEIPSIEMKSEDERFQPFRELLLQLHEEAQNEDEMVMEEKESMTMETIKGMGFGELRDACLAFNPLDVEHVKRCNKAEAEFWRRSEGYQVRPSHELLQFDCGGQVSAAEKKDDQKTVNVGQSLMMYSFVNSISLVSNGFLRRASQQANKKKTAVMT